jgi:UDP-2-acetamido-2,6-beta-L-arabino-hexul-4-ose reductase
MRILVTGAAGFVGSNLCFALRRRLGDQLYPIDKHSSAEDLERALRDADAIFHLAGVNRPDLESQFHEVNALLTEQLCARLSILRRTPKIVFASSIQAELDNAYGRSKLHAERMLERFVQSNGGTAVVHRLRNLFGKWCRPNYNSVTATFCHNIARGLPIEISDPSRLVNLTYIDDVVDAFQGELDVQGSAGFRYAAPLASTDIALGKLAELIRSFQMHRSSLLVPDFSDRFVRALYATYLSYLQPDEFGYSLTQRVDQRGSLAEFIKQGSFGQIFVSRTNPGITRGNHYHNTKTEKFLVVEGKAVIRFRQISSEVVESFLVDGEDYRVVDIPPGYTHSIENVGTGELVTLFWSSEVFDDEAPDTFALPVLK